MFERIITEIFLKYFERKEFKHVYLHNELFISLYKWDDFFFCWLIIQADEVIFNIYSDVNSKLWKVLYIIFVKYKELFKNYLILKKKSFHKVWNETDFINIYDDNKISYDELINNLYFTYLDDYSYRRRKEMNFKLEKSYVDLYHSDFECSICDWPREAFANFPNYQKKVDFDYFPEFKDLEKVHLHTYITDYESISIWWNPKVSEILSDKDFLNNYEMVTINKTCISVIMWDDIESILKYNNIPENKTIYTDQNIDSWYKAVINFLKKINVKNWLKKHSNDRIIFFWLSKIKDTYEIIKFLDENLNIKVDKVFIPNINKDDLEEILKYNLWVFFNWLEVKTQSIFLMYPIESIESSIPYWLTKFKELILNINKIIWWNDSKIENILNKYLLENNNLLSDSNNYKLWFILYPFHLKMFNDNNFRGVPILSLLKDLWFKIEIFIYSKDLSKYEKDYNDFLKNWFNTRLWENKWDLDLFFKDETINLYYSEVANDKRILNFNKWQFSVWDFEYWIDGFFRTLNWLLIKAKKQEYFNKIYNYEKWIN